MQSPDADFRDIIRPLANCSRWMKALGVALAILGLAQIPVTIIGVLWAWAPIWGAVLLFQVANAAVQAVALNDAAAAVRATTKLRLFFISQGIMLVCVLVALVAALAIFIFGFEGLPGMPHH